MARASALTSNRSWCRLCSQATSSLPTTSGPTRSPASGGLSRPPGPHSGTCHPIARTSIPSSSASRSSRPSFAPHAVAAVRRSGRSSVPVSSASALTNAATIFGTAGTQPPHGHEKRSKGTYVSIEPFHLFRYLDEHAFRFNTRKATDAERFKALASLLAGRRLTYKQLTGKVGYTPA